MGDAGEAVLFGQTFLQIRNEAFLDLHDPFAF